MPAPLLAMPEALDALRQAVAATERAARDDRETVGQLAGHAERIDAELAELRDGLQDVAAGVVAIGRRLNLIERPAA